jgi:hypothetical protein
LSLPPRAEHVKTKRASKRGAGGGRITETELRGEITEKLWVLFKKSVTFPQYMALVMDEGLDIDHWWIATEKRT